MLDSGSINFGFGGFGGGFLSDAWLRYLFVTKSASLPVWKSKWDGRPWRIAER